jgi:hypothetical protein
MLLLCSADAHLILLAEGLRFIVAPLVESEALVRPFSPGSTLEPGLKTFRRRGPK